MVGAGALIWQNDRYKVFGGGCILNQDPNQGVGHLRIHKTTFQTDAPDIEEGIRGTRTRKVLLEHSE